MFLLNYRRIINVYKLGIVIGIVIDTAISEFENVLKTINMYFSWFIMQFRTNDRYKYI